MTRRRRRRESFEALRAPADRHGAADGRRRARRHRRLLRAAGVAAAAGRLSRSSRSAPASPARARTRWPPAWPRRWSATSARSPASTRSPRRAVGTTRVTLQFDLGRNIDGAAREVQAAINASRVDLPTTLRSNPTYRKANPAAAPVIILALTSKTKTPGQIYDAVSNIISQRLSQVDGVGDVEIGGGSLPAVRIELLPFALNQLRHQHRGRARRDPGEQREPAQGHRAGRRPAPADLHPDAGAARERLRADGGRLAQRRRGAPAGRGPGRRRRRGHAHARPLQRRAGDHRADHAPALGQRDRDGGCGARAAAGAAGRAAGRREACRSPPTAPIRSARRCARSSSR